MATLYCGPTGTGTGTGADFNNRLALPTTTGFTRGNVYVVIEGSYGSKTLSTAASGSSTITIRKASTADSAVAGYSTTLFDTPATFGDMIVATPYWIINGVTRTETNRMEEPLGYGIRITGTIKSSTGDTEDASNSQFSYLDVGGTWDEGSTPNCSTTAGAALYFVFSQHDISFDHCVFHNRGSDNSAIAMMHGSSDITFDHCDFYMGWGKATIAAPNSSPERWTIRYCRFWNSSRLDSECGTEGGGITCEVGSYTSGLGTFHDGHLVYGNVFYGTASGGRNSSVQFGDGNASSGEAINCKAFNNTFAGFPEAASLGLVYLYAGSGNEVRNNLVWDTVSANFTANTTSNNVDAGADPFVDYANLDFRLSDHTSAGFDVGAPYNVDPLGTIRGSGGNWDVGAYQFDGEEPTNNITYSGTLTVTDLIVG